MKSRTWFLLSIALFIAAAFFWRLGEQKRLAQQNAKQPAAVSAKKSGPISSQVSSKTISPKKPPTDSLPAETNATNSKSLYPNRLSNTTKTIDQLARDNQAILLRNALIDTRVEAPNIPEHLRAKGDPGSYIVQARGPLTDLFRAELSAAKAEIVSYVPNNAYLVRMNRGGVEKLMGNKDVESILPYEPYYKLDTDLLELAVKKEALSLDKIVRVTWFPGQLDAGVKALPKGSVVGEDLKSSPFGPESLVSTADLVALANLPEVQGVERSYERTLFNDLTRVRLGISTNSLITTLNHQGLTGSNVFVNVNDTTIDNGHPDLTPRIFPGAGVGITDTDGHGTMVAGIITSSGAPDQPNGTNVPGSVAGADFRGKAPAAKIFSLDIFAGLSDWQLQETAARTNLFAFNRNSPLISNNSWGYGSSSYNSAAASYDMAVRDAIPGVTNSQPMIYVFAAGNGGGGNNNGQGGFSGSVISPSTAKNVITVGVLENPRNITNDIIRPNRSCVIVTNKEFLGLTDSSNQVAFLSSRGNVGVSLEGTFGRFKPDVVAPGTFIVSTRSRQLDEGVYYSTTNFIVNTFRNLVIDPGDTNRFSIFVPDDPCDEGRAISFSIDTLANGNSPSPFPPLRIFVDTAPVPSAAPANFVATNSVTLVPGDAKFARGTVVYYDIVNTNSIEVNYNLRTEIVVTNDYGNYFKVLKSLNDSLGTNYFYRTGSSMAAPAISGMLALMQEFFEKKLSPPLTNSPAMMKALLINCARSPNDLLYKLDATSSLNIAGWGLPNLTRALPAILLTAPTNEWPIQMIDQSTNDALATGETYTRNITVADTNSPLRITLVWTDPPGNPQVGVKLVNDLDLVVKTVVTNVIGTNMTVSTNIYFGNHFTGGSQFTDPIDVGTNALASFDAARDVVNNVENVYINGPLSGAYEVSVVARRVNVNAVRAHTNGIVQDYALVISSGNLTTNAPFAIAPATPPLVSDPRPFVTNVVTVITNGIALLNQRVGANAPLLNLNASGLSDGITNQWNFYAINAGNLPNVAFLTFLPPNLSGTTNVSPNSRRNVEADIDMYVSTDPTLTNLNPIAIANADKSRGRGGQELIIYTNANQPTFYVGIKSEDQQGAEYSFFGIASALPFSQDNGNGGLILRNIVPIPGGNPITDGAPEKPGGGYSFAFATKPINVARVIVTNTFTHERIGDLLGTLTHSDTFAVLNNHSFPVSPAFPDGQESGTFTGIYDDSELGNITGSRTTDGPGSLNDFVGQEGVGAWMLTMEDNALNATGRVDFLALYLERSLDTNQLTSGSGFTISSTQIPGGESRALNFVVPAGATNMIIRIAPKEGPIDLVVRRGLKSPTRVAPGGPYVEYGKLINPPGGSLTIGLTNTPPLRPGRYSLRLFNDGGSPVTVSGTVTFELNLSAASFQSFVSSAGKAILDDAVTNSTINVNRGGRVVDIEVGVRIDHPRVSDLVLHLVSPQGTRILLAENRGGLSTNGYGTSTLTTNVFPVTSTGDANPNTNIFSTAQNSGTINIDYDFFQVPDQLQIYYDGLLIYDTGLISGAGTISVPFGPGLSTNVVVVVNGQGNPNPTTQWRYTATLFSGQIIYTIFSENTNRAIVPIKFAPPPFAIVSGASNLTLLTSGFEGQTAGAYTNGQSVDGWIVTNNQVGLISDPALAQAGSNFLALSSGTIMRTLPTTAGRPYSLSYAHRGPGITDWWPAEGNAIDLIGGNNGTVSSGVTYVAGKVGSAFNFDGSTNPVVNFGSTAGNFGTNDFAIEFWIRTSSTRFEEALMEKRSVCNGSQSLFELRIGGPGVGVGHLAAELLSAGGVNYGSLVSARTINDGIFHHISLVREKTNLSFYIDGILDRTTATPGIANVNNGSNFKIGQSICQCCDGTVPFTGVLDELALFNRALSPVEIAAIYGAGSVGKFTPVSPIPNAQVRIGGNTNILVNNSLNWQIENFGFTALTSGTIAELEGNPLSILFDSFQLDELPSTNNYFLPEESLKTLIGEGARGEWQLEVWDNRAGAPLAQLVSWRLDLTFASIGAAAAKISSGVSANNTVNGAEIKYFIVDVPIFASQATNTLVSGGGPLNLLFNQDQLPVGNPAFGDATLLFGTVNGTKVLTTTTLPMLEAGRRYYLGVQNVSAAQTNSFTLTVTFDDTNNLVTVTPLQNAVPISTNIPLSTSIHYYQYDLANSVTSIEFKLFNLSADADLVVRRGSLPSPTGFDYNSNNGGTNQDIINVLNPAPGRYYLGVYGFFPTNGITYSIMATEGPAAAPPFAMLSPSISASNFQVTANTIIGRQYQFEVSTNLITWSLVSTTTATANVTTFTDTTPPPTQTARFYRLRLLP